MADTNEPNAQSAPPAPDTVPEPLPVTRQNASFAPPDAPANAPANAPADAPANAPADASANAPADASAGMEIEPPDGSDEGEEADDDALSVGDPEDDINDADNLKFIENGLRYHELKLKVKHAKAFVALGFEFEHRKGKEPTRQRANWLKHCEDAEARLSKYEKKYADNRRKAKKRRADAIAKEKSAQASEKANDKKLRVQLKKALEKQTKLAMEAAMAAVREMADDADNDAVKVRALKAAEEAAAASPLALIDQVD